MIRPRNRGVQAAQGVGLVGLVFQQMLVARAGDHLHRAAQSAQRLDVRQGNRRVCGPSSR